MYAKAQHATHYYIRSYFKLSVIISHARILAHSFFCQETFSLALVLFTKVWSWDQRGEDGGIKCTQSHGLLPWFSWTNLVSCLLSVPGMMGQGYENSVCNHRDVEKLIYGRPGF